MMFDKKSDLWDATLWKSSIVDGNERH